MPETRARFLANTIGATTTDNDFTLPNGVGTDKQVLQTDGEGGTNWANTLSAPTISSVTGKLNEYEDGVSEDGGVLTINGSDFGSDASTVSVQISGTTGFSTVAETTTISLASTTQLTATFTGAETNYNHSSFSAGSTIYIKVTKSGLQTSTYATLGTAMTGDPAFSTTSTTASTHTGTLGATSLGSYGGQVAGGGGDPNTKLLLNFDRFDGSTDIEDSSNSGGNGHAITVSNDAVIKSSPFGDGKSAIKFDGSGSRVVVPNHEDFGVGDNSTKNPWSLDYWVAPDTSTSGGIVCICGISGTDASSSNAGLVTYIDGSQNLAWFMDDDSLDDWDMTSGASGFTFPANLRWHHIAVTYGGSTDQNYRLFVDGTLIKTVSTSATIYSTSNSQGLLLGANQSSSAHFKGYLDEIRWVLGENPFPTSGFTPSSIRYGTTGASHEVNTATNMKLLIHSNQEDDSSGNSTPITVVGTAYPVSETNNRGSGAHANFGSSAWYFDGGGDYLTFPMYQDFAGATQANTSTYSDITIEGWFKFGTNADQGFWGIDGVNELALYYESGSQVLTLREKYSGNQHSNNVFSISHSYTTDWQHIALVRTGNITKLYVNGTLGTTVLNALPSFTAGEIFEVGTDAYGTSREFQGHIDSFRISIVDRYPNEFSPSTSALTADNNTIILIQGDNGNFTDSGTHGHTAHVIGFPNGMYHSQDHGSIAPAMAFPASKKLTGSAGIYFDGTGDKLTVPYSDDFNFDSASSPWTIDFWANNSGGQSSYGLVSYWASTGRCWAIQYGDASSTVLGLANGTGGSSGTQGTTINSTISSSDIGTGVWHHYAVVNDGTNIKFYLDGVAKGSGSSVACGGSGHTNATLEIGAWSAGAGHFNGYIDSLRISKGVARWNSAFNTALPTQIYGAYLSQDVGTIQLNADASASGGGALDYAELSGGTALSTYGLSLSSTGAITGTLSGLASNSNSGGVIRIRARANADDNRVTTLGGASFTGITQNEGKIPVLFEARRYRATSTARDLNGFGLKADLVWIKERDGSSWHSLFDSVRGGTKVLHPNDTASQSTRSGNQGFIESYNNDGVSLSSDSSDNGTNHGTHAMIAWGFKAGGAPSSSALSLSSGVGAGTIADNATGVSGVKTITQSVNQNSGFSITAYTGNTNSGTATFPHNLGGTPDFVIVKKLSEATWGWWVTYHSSLADNYNLQLNESISQYVSTDTTYAKGGWIDGPSSTLINLSAGSSNTDSVSYVNKTYICYAWKAIPGVSAFGSYVSVSGGQRVYTTHNGNAPDQGGTNGFRPKFIMTKAIDYTSSYAGWTIIDGSRVDFGSNSSGDSFAKSETLPLFANQAYPEGKRGGDSSDVSEVAVDMFDDGFKFDGANNPESNGFGNSPASTHIYIAFA